MHSTRSALFRAVITSSRKAIASPRQPLIAPRRATPAAASSSARSFINGHSYSTASSAGMSIEASMRTKLEKEFAPAQVTIRNDSSKHAHHAAMAAQGGGNGETHFFVEIVTPAFEGKNQLARHRLVNALMAPEFEQGLHALSLRTKTPEEVAKGR